MKILILLLLLISNISYAETDYLIEQPLSQMAVEFDLRRTNDVNGLKDLVEIEYRITACVSDYIKTQKNTYAKIAKLNLYDLIHNIDKIAIKLSGKKPIQEEVSFEEKLETLARLQCEVYNSIGVLK